jgi:hypothetical protein
MAVAKYLFLTVSFLFVHLHVSFAQTQEGTNKQSEIELSLGTQKQVKDFNFIDLGAVPPSSKRQVLLGVRCLADCDLDLDLFYVGSKIKTSWVKDAATGTIGSRRKITSSLSYLSVSFEAGTADTQDLQVIFLSRNSIPVARIVLDYVVRDEMIAFNIASPRLASGVGKAFSNADGKGDYVLCSGLPPPGYVLSSHSFTLDNVDRRCGEFSNCNLAKTDSEDVCYIFNIQGREDKDFKGVQIAYAGATLTVNYKLNEKAPSLR